jgi:hypothetical protein
LERGKEAGTFYLTQLEPDATLFCIFKGQKVSDRKMRQGLRPVAWPDSQAARAGIEILFKKTWFGRIAYRHSAGILF